MDEWQARLTDSVLAAMPRAEADPARPAFHFRPPAQWMNDPNGTLFHNGWHHVFYQFNPFGDVWGHIHWGHARSRDLVHWEHLPPALGPDPDRGERHCFSGCLAISQDGRPVILYTSVGNALDRSGFTQCAALGDDELVRWERHEGNPVLTLDSCGGLGLRRDWRDPFVFEDRGRTFMILGAVRGRESVIPIFECEDGSLLNWRHRGVLYRHLYPVHGFMECPNIFKLGGRWTLLFNPFRPVKYRVGGFDPETLRFRAEARGKVDHGRAFYASNIIIDDRGRTILLGWIRLFRPGRGWSGCLSLPRELGLDAEGNLLQTPIPQLERLRRGSASIRGVLLHSGGSRRVRAGTDMIEIEARMRNRSAREFGLRLTAGPGRSAAVSVGADRVNIAGKPAPRPGAEAATEIRVFVDRSVMEVFVDRGRICATRVVDLFGGGLAVEAFAEGGACMLESLTVHEFGPAGFDLSRWPGGD